MNSNLVLCYFVGQEHHSIFSKAFEIRKLRNGFSILIIIIIISHLLTTEKREQIIKDMKSEVENNFKKAIRQIRQKYMQEIDKVEGMPEDSINADKKFVQDQIDEINNELERLTEEKTKDILTI
mgnify:CR=1 FL=1